MNSQRSLEKSGGQERRKTIQEIFDQALDNSAAELKSQRLVARVDESLEDKASQKEIFQACLEASKSYIGADPGMREVAADIFLQKWISMKKNGSSKCMWRSVRTRALEASSCRFSSFLIPLFPCPGRGLP